MKKIVIVISSIMYPMIYWFFSTVLFLNLLVNHKRTLCSNDSKQLNDLEFWILGNQLVDKVFKMGHCTFNRFRGPHVHTGFQQLVQRKFTTTEF